MAAVVEMRLSGKGLLVSAALPCFNGRDARFASQLSACGKSWIVI